MIEGKRGNTMKRAIPRAGGIFQCDAALTAAEYAIILALIVGALLGTVLIMGGRVELMFASLSSEVSGVFGESGSVGANLIPSGTDRIEGRIGANQDSESRHAILQNRSAWKQS